MTSDRLTKNELTWLLAQEARSASQKLRQGVTLTYGGSEPSIPPAPLIQDGGQSSGGVEGTLNQLDQAVNMLASLHGHPLGRGRRGKIDLAALLWEIMPEARVQIEMGEGTTVFGDEAELKRMLHVLISRGGDPSSARDTPGVTIRREGDDVRIGVNLGPDTPATFEAERVWLSRMAIRYGGRLELDGSMQTLVLAADVDTHRRELESLKKELAAAQAQGEAYALELAAMFTRGNEASAIPGPPPLPGALSTVRASRMPASGDGLPVLVAAVRVLSVDLRGILSTIGREVSPLRDRDGDVGEVAASVGRHVTAASDVVGDLARLGACPIGEAPRQTDVADLLREAVQTDRARAARHEVKLTLRSPENADDLVPAAGLYELFHVLLDHAIHASPAGSEVIVSLLDPRADGGGAIEVTFEDAGPPLPASAQGGVLSRDFEALALGRPRAFSLIAANAIAAHLRYPVDFDAGPRGGARVRLTLSRSST